MSDKHTSQRPKKPSSAYFIFRNHWLAKDMKAHPDAKDRQDRLNKEYKALSESERQKLQKQFETDKAHYEKALEQFFQAHPEERDRKRSVSKKSKSKKRSVSKKTASTKETTKRSSSKKERSESAKKSRSKSARKSKKQEEVAQSNKKKSTTKGTMKGKGKKQ